MLSITNQHPRDLAIQFFDEYQGREHVYLLEGAPDYPTSVTTLIHKHFEHFDADKIIDKYYNKWQGDLKNKYYGLSKEQIKQLWEDNRVDASTKGTNMHKAIEDFFNGELVEEPDTKEFGYFKNWWKSFTENNPTYRPYRTEWMVYNDKKTIAGSIDYTTINHLEEITIFDWKRSKEIKAKSPFGKKGLWPLKHLDDCNYAHYCLQLNCYRLILMNFYGKKVNGMYLIILHPDNNNYMMLPVPVLEREASELLGL